MEWTKSQSDAINARGCTLLVSAAAGSGKTAVLTQRIISRLTDEENPLSIDRIVVLTFTKKAASELRERISKALNTAAKERHSSVLYHQLMLLPSARISTIDSFCSSLVKEYFEKLGISARMRTLEVSENDILLHDVMQKMSEELYDSADESDLALAFREVADCVVKSSDDNLINILTDLYTKLLEKPRGVDELKNSYSLASQDIMDSTYGKVIEKILRDITEHFYPIYRNAVELFKDGGALEKNYYPAFLSNFKSLDLLKGNLGSGYDEIKSIIDSFEFPRLGSGVRNESDKEAAEPYKNARKELKKAVEGDLKGLFCAGTEQLENIANKTDLFNYYIYNILSEYNKRVIAEKNRKSAISFNDIERLTYKLLYDENGQKTDLSAEISAKYDEIYIDEYQDINPLQHNIFSAISRENSLFMVGDIKQSIYGFRGSTPQLFSSMTDEFDYYNAEESSGGNKKIFLSNNFRCDSPIIDFTNALTDLTMPYGSGTTHYSREEHLIYSKKSDGHNVRKCELDIIVQDSEVNGQAKKGNDSECEFIALRIRQLLNEGIKPSDIVILIRNAKGNGTKIEKALKKAEIPVYNSASRDLFVNAEVMLMLSLLRCIDNPSRDIYLAATLKSPLYGFTLDELIEIRQSENDGTLYSALQHYTENYDFAKGRFFLGKLASYRKMSRSAGVDKLIWFIYRDTSLISALCKNGASRSSSVRNNLMLLYDFARSYEKNGSHGLYSFISYINDITESRYELSSAAAVSESADVVRIMTIHASKGLEFPVVFLCNTDKSNKGAADDSTLLLGENGITLNVRRDGDIVYEYSTYHLANKRINKNLETDEAMRLLYVAMTRARERLIITGCTKNTENLQSQCSQLALHPDRFSVTNSPNYLKWLYSAVLSDKSSGEYCELNVIEDVEEIKADSDISDKADNDNGINPEFVSELERRFSFRYKNSHLENIPAKLSVSKLSPDVLDYGEDGNDFSLLKSDNEPTAIGTLKDRPDFLAENKDNISGAQRGTATHLFMQFCNYENAEKMGVDYEINRLVEKGYILPETAVLINKYQLKHFFSSELYSQMKRAKKLWREFRFNVYLPASDYSSVEELKIKLAGENILVQGVMDCFFIDDNDRLILVDYKTDYIADGEGIDKLIERYSMQLGYYRQALTRIFGREVDKTMIYSFALGESVEIKTC